MITSPANNSGTFRGGVVSARCGADRAEGARRLADQYVDRANCSALVMAIGSTPNSPRWSSM